MKRYLFFTYDGYYPEGGWHDFRGEFDRLDEAVLAGEASRRDLWHVVDMAIKEIVRNGRKVC